MILIVGSSRDDTLYFQNLLKEPKEETLFGKYTLLSGHIFNQNIVILTNVFTSYVSSALISYLVEKLMVTLVISVGKCRSLNNNLKTGDIAVSKEFICLDVDQIEIENVQLGQIPGPISSKGGANKYAYPQAFNLSMEVMYTFNDCLEKLNIFDHYDCTFLSSNTYYRSKNQLSAYMRDGKVFGIDNNVVFESETGGAAVACTLHDVPLLAVKVVESALDEKTDIAQYVTVLNRYASVGKAVISFIGEIGRNDVLPNPGGER